MASTYNYEYFNVTFPREYVAQVEINRPQKMNAFNETMWKGIGQIFERLSHDQEVRCVVLTSAGDRAFSAGLDVQSASETGVLSGNDGLDAARVAQRLRHHIDEFQASISQIEKCEKPVIAVLHGVSFGLALDMTLCADIRICVSTTRFAVKEVDIGLAADIGTLTRLPKANIPMSFIKDVALTARIFSAKEALAVGIVSAIYDTKAEALSKAVEKAELIASKSPVAIMGTKEVLNFSRDHSVQDGLRYVSVWNAAYCNTADVTDSLTAGIQKTKPRYAKL
ncbi:ClpP/crotonase [Aureobasidium pullulans]|uniref:ClpP/crotonase n=2 Tax=Aureobasidium pullulans TaxID=5580 RepID=A0A4S9YAQ5_AURPU|nr:ClpP/crotonase [Aureobasidium pullulans]THW21722.1 ClpP/crotonase [Aureobasidium pullulans]THW36345.1 ClpP/crotonase [Aureobasidium pullulans]THW95437.1 ClpP/crotonase [Aureobasidium pullulans]THX34450.1 ClpP/crotonase [Aureobasidium pullulans]